MIKTNDFLDIDIFEILTFDIELLKVWYFETDL